MKLIFHSTCCSLSANTTMIKRTFYRESIITGSGIETPELERMLDTQTTMLSHSASKSKLTTRVTLNLRNFKRRSSEFGLPQLDTDELNQSPRMTEARHSICGNELAFGCRSSNVINTTSGRALEQFLNGPGALRNVSCTCVPTSLSQLSMNFSTKSNRKVRVSGSCRIAVSHYNHQNRIINYLLFSLFAGHSVHRRSLYR